MASKPLKPPKRRPSSKASKVTHASEITTINGFLIAATILTGILAWAVGNFIYTALHDTMSRPLLIGIIFVILYGMLGIVVFSTSNLKGYFRKNIITGSSSAGGILLLLLAAGAVVFVAAALFQWIYGLSFGQTDSGPTSFIFVIDDSESMLDSDPQRARYAAIPTVLAGMDKDFPYMIYRFSDNIERIRDMAPISAGVSAPTGLSAGRTAIRAALSQVAADCENGVWEGGSRPKVILLTDGHATDMDYLSDIDPVLKRLTAAQISVSTIGLGAADRPLLDRIAQTTDGIFVDVSDVSELSAAMMSAAGRAAERDLVSAREAGSLGVLYGILRILFLTLLGTAIGLLMAVAYGFQDAVGLIAGSSVIKAVVGALFMELGTAAGLPAKIMWLILWIMIALTIASKILPKRKTVERTPHTGVKDTGSKNLSPY